MSAEPIGELELYLQVPEMVKVWERLHAKSVEVSIDPVKFFEENGYDPLTPQERELYDLLNQRMIDGLTKLDK